MNDMRNFSDMTVLQPANEQEIYEEIKRQEESGLYDEKGLIDLGNWQNARCALTGSVTKVSPRGYLLDMHITEMQSNKILAAAMKTGDELDRLLSDVSAELLAGMNIGLTEKGRQALYSRKIQSGAALAQSLMAGRKGGTTFETLHYAYEASYFDLSSADAANRVSGVSLSLTGNSLENQLAEYQHWVGLMKECEDFYQNHLPYEIVYDPALVQTGKTDYERNTVNLEFTIALLKDPAAFKAIETFQRMLKDTGKLDTWKDNKLSSGPAIKQEVKLKADLLDEGGGLLGTTRFDLEGLDKAVFRNVKVSGVSDTLTLRITEVDGINAEAAGERGYIKISTLEEFNRNLMPHPLDLATVIDKTTEITGEDPARVLPEMTFLGFFPKPIAPYMISRKMITVSQWVVFAKWAEDRGYRLRKDTQKVMASLKSRIGSIASSVSGAWDTALTLLSNVEDKPATDISSSGVQIFCNAFSNFSGKPPAYTLSGLLDFSGSSTQEQKGGEDLFVGSVEDNTGFRRPTRTELRFAHFGGDPRLSKSSFDKNPYSIGKGVSYEDTFGPDYQGFYDRVAMWNSFREGSEASDMGFRLVCSIEEN
jgi:hypothetical protein